jgi:hypothetical protein
MRKHPCQVSPKPPLPPTALTFALQPNDRPVGYTRAPRGKEKTMPYPTAQAPDEPRADTGTPPRDNVYTRTEQLRVVLRLLRAVDEVSPDQKLMQAATERLRPLVTSIVVQGDLALFEAILVHSAGRSYDETAEALRQLDFLARQAVCEITNSMER